MRALRGRLRGTTRAVPKIAGSSVKAHLRLADCLHEEVGHAHSVEGGTLPSSKSLGQLIEGANATCSSGQSRSQSRSGALAAGSCVVESAPFRRSQVRTGRPSSVGKVEFLLIATSRSVAYR